MAQTCPIGCFDYARTMLCGGAAYRSCTVSQYQSTIHTLKKNRKKNYRPPLPTRTRTRTLNEKKTFTDFDIQTCRCGGLCKICIRVLAVCSTYVKNLIIRNLRRRFWEENNTMVMWLLCTENSVEHTQSHIRIPVWPEIRDS